MAQEILYESDHPRITVTLEDNGDVVLSRADRYMRNPNGAPPSFVPELCVLINANKGK